MNVNRKAKLIHFGSVDQDGVKPESNNNNDGEAIANPSNDDEKAKYFKTLDGDTQKRLEYLMGQAQIYSHFVETGGTQKQKVKAIKPKPMPKSKKQELAKRNSALHDDIVDDAAKPIYVSKSPHFINGSMRDYQIEGLNWFLSLYDKGINGILADDMGLGKTLQTISVLGYHKKYNKMNGPHLVVAPLSTLVNWRREFEKFCPSMKVFILIGTGVERRAILNKKIKENDWDVCILSYETCRNEQKNLRKIAWRYVVIDEAHRIKNENTQVSAAVRTFTSTNRILLTGTPLQNDVHELWALLNFLLPDVFNSAGDFDKWFDPDVCLNDDDMVKRLQTILQPFMLRRIKADVEKTLLPKIETKIFCGMPQLQREWYRKVLMKDITVMTDGFKASKMSMHNLLMHLRKCANHPYLFPGAEPEPLAEGEHLVENSGKMIVLDKLLAKLKAQGSKVLIFSAFKMILDIIEDYCGLRDYAFFRLDGGTDYKKRVADMDAFNSKDDKTFIYMITTRAGGLGITLTGADTVIIFDSDWNPQADLQAIDRAHRIGQTKQVHVFRLITEHTADEKIIEIAERKMKLDNIIIQQGRAPNKPLLSDKERLEAVRHGAQYVLSSSAVADANLIDLDIEKILARSEVKTAGLTTKYEKAVKRDATSLQVFEGVDFREERKKLRKF